MGENIYIEKSVIIEEGAVVEPFTVIKGKSVIKKGAVVESFSYLNNAVIEKGAPDEQYGDFFGGKLLQSGL